jgi:hypothetical protein
MKAVFKVPSFFLIVAACLWPAAPANAVQSGPTPEQYSVTEINGLFGPSLTVQIYRDGQMAMQESSGPPADNFPKGMHTRTFYDLRAGKQYTIDLNNPSSGCGAGNFSGDWGDPFAASAQLLADDPDNKKAKLVGTETVSGVSTKVFQTVDPGSKSEIKYWLDETRHLLMKVQMAPPGGAAKTMLEIKQVSLTKPAASLLALPAVCRAAAAAPAPPTEQERIAAETGGNGANYANAIMPPPSKTACNVVFKIVQAKTLQPIMNFKIGLDRQIDPEHMPSYTMGGSATFSGGNIHDVTGQLRSGALHIDNAPPQFDMELLFGNAGAASALIYRQCFGPETTLLFVVKNPQKMSDGGHWLWVKK